MTVRKSTEMSKEDAIAILQDVLEPILHRARSWERRALCEKLHCSEDEYELQMYTFIQEVMDNCDQAVEAYNDFKRWTEY